MKFAIITTCMGRAEHLKVSLPKMLDQDYVDYSFCKDSAVVVVDWDSKDDLQDVLYEHRGPYLHSIKKEGQEHFHLSAARNAGAKFAIDHLPLLEWLVFVDADILLPPEFLSNNAPLLEGWVSEQGFLHTQKTDDGDFQIWGSCFVRADDWKRVKYDEAITGYGFEDNDFYERLLEAGLKHHPMDVQGVDTIEHPEAMRFVNYPEEYVDGQDYGRDRC